MSDYSLKITVRNAHLLRAMRSRGFASASELARAASISVSQACDLLSCKRSAKTAEGEWRSSVYAVCTALNMMPDQLFTERQAVSALKKNSAEVENSEQDITAVCGDSPELGLLQSDIVQRALLTLTDRERGVVTARFYDGATLEDLAKENGPRPITRERIRCVEQKALRKMRRALKSAGIEKYEDAFS